MYILLFIFLSLAIVSIFARDRWSSGLGVVIIAVGDISSIVHKVEALYDEFANNDDELFYGRFTPLFYM